MMSQYLLCIQLISHPSLEALSFLELNKSKLNPLHQSLPAMSYTWVGVIRMNIARIIVQNNHKISCLWVIFVRWTFIQGRAAAHTVF